MVSCRPIKEIIEAFCLCLKRKKCAEYLRSLRDKYEITPVDKVLNDFKKHVWAIWRADSDYILGACYIGYIITNVFLHGVFLFLDKIVSKIQILLFHMNNKHCKICQNTDFLRLIFSHISLCIVPLLLSFDFYEGWEMYLLSWNTYYETLMTLNLLFVFNPLLRNVVKWSETL